jgi:alginate O-acetyltransferase complex protein AlgI
LLPIFIYSIPVILYHALYCYRDNHWVHQLLHRYDYVLYGIMLFLILTNSGSVSPFVYFQF